jgi:hypothetical protein
MSRILSGLLALLLAGNGAAMLAAGRWWYGAVPGVTSTGPFNPHFVKDIGAAYLVCAAAFGWRALRPAQGWSAAVAAAAFLVLHALVHVADAFAGGHAGHDLARDFAGIFLIAALAVAAAWPPRQGGS